MLTIGRKIFRRYFFPRYVATVGPVFRAARHARRAATGTSRYGFRYCAITMVKNEEDIISRSVAHALSLMDAVVVIDDGSTDGTRKILEDLGRCYPTLAVFDREYVRGDPSLGYMQAHALTWAARYAADHLRPEWIFPLDADEFLPFSDRTALHSAFGRYQNKTVVSMRWRNGYPVDTVEPDPARCRFVFATHPSYFGKIAFQPDRIARGGWEVSSGAHKLLSRRTRTAPYSKIMGTELIHIPCRSVGQARRKIDLQARMTLTEVAGGYEHTRAVLANLQGPEMAKRFVAMSYQGGASKEPFDIDQVLATPTEPPEVIDIAGLTRPIDPPGTSLPAVPHRGGTLRMSPSQTSFSPD